MMNHPTHGPAAEDIKAMREQLDDAEGHLIERWKELAQALEDMSRIVGGGMTEDDAELVMKCVETCVAQCMLFGMEFQVQQLENSHEKPS